MTTENGDPEVTHLEAPPPPEIKPAPEAPEVGATVPFDPSEPPTPVAPEDHPALAGDPKATPVVEDDDGEAG